MLSYGQKRNMQNLKDLVHYTKVRNLLLTALYSRTSSVSDDRTIGPWRGQIAAQTNSSPGRLPGDRRAALSMGSFNAENIVDNTYCTSAWMQKVTPVSEPPPLNLYLPHDIVHASDISVVKGCLSPQQRQGLSCQCIVELKIEPPLVASPEQLVPEIQYVVLDILGGEIFIVIKTWRTLYNNKNTAHKAAG